MAQELQPGEHVSWSYGAGQAKGQVVEKLTENKKLGSRVFKASPDDPKYLVKSDASGKEAIKKPQTLHKIDHHEEEARHADTAPTEGNTHAQIEVASRQEVGAKEKRDGFKQRSSQDEGEQEESAKKVVDTGKGSARASAKVAKANLKQVAEVPGEAGVAQLDEGEEKDESYQPKEDEMETAEEDEENVAEVIAQVDKEAQEELDQDESAGAVEEDELPMRCTPHEDSAST